MEKGKWRREKGEGRRAGTSSAATL